MTGGHELAARGRTGQDAAGFIHVVTGAVHVRQYEGARDGHIGHGGAGDHADEGVGEHGRESGPATQAAAQDLAGFHEQAFHLEDAQQRAEDHEQEDLVGADGHEQAVQLGQAHTEHGDHIIKGKDGMMERAAEHVPKEEVGHEDHGHDEQRQAPAQPGAQGRAQHEADADDDGGLGGEALGHLQFFRVQIDIGAADERHEHAGIQQKLDGLVGRLACVAHEDQQEQEGKVDGLVFPLRKIQVLGGNGVVKHHGQSAATKNHAGCKFSRSHSRLHRLRDVAPGRRSGPVQGSFGYSRPASL